MTARKDESAARPMAAAVLRPTGSARMCRAGTPGIWRRTSAACSSLVTTQIARGKERRKTARPSADHGLAPTILSNCLGVRVRLRGQKRVPRPPARITAWACSSSRCVDSRAIIDAPLATTPRHSGAPIRRARAAYCSRSGTKVRRRRRSATPGADPILRPARREAPRLQPVRSFRDWDRPTRCGRARKWNQQFKALAERSLPPRARRIPIFRWRSSGRRQSTS